VAFGELPLRDQEAEILISHATGVAATRSAATSADDNVKIVRLELELAGDDSARGRFEVETKGAFASHLLGNLLAESEQKQKEQTRDWLWIDRGSVSKTSHRAEEREGRRVALAEGLVEIPRIVGRSGETRLLRLSDVFYSPGPNLPPGERKHPVVLDKRERRLFEMALKLPPGSAVRALPEPAVVESEIGKYRLEWSAEAGVVRARWAYEIHQRIVPAAQYEALISFLREIRVAAQRGVLIRRAG
jgi:hypothetical protein